MQNGSWFQAEEPLSDQPWRDAPFPPEYFNKMRLCFFNLARYFALISLRSEYQELRLLYHHPTRFASAGMGAAGASVWSGYWSRSGQ